MPGESFSFGGKREEHRPSVSVVLLYMVDQRLRNDLISSPKTHPSARILPLTSLDPSTSALSIWRETLTPEAGFPWDESNTKLVVVFSQNLES